MILFHRLKVSCLSARGLTYRNLCKGKLHVRHLGIKVNVSNKGISVMPHFRHCSTVWHFCGVSSVVLIPIKWNSINKHLPLNGNKIEVNHVLQILFNDKAITYEVLLESLGLISLRKRRLLDMLIVVDTTVRPPKWPHLPTCQHYVHLELTLMVLEARTSYSYHT